MCRRNYLPFRSFSVLYGRKYPGGPSIGPGYLEFLQILCDDEITRREQVAMGRRMRRFHKTSRILADRLVSTSHQVFMNGPSYRPNKRPKVSATTK
jgi:hypothetical protein